MAIQNLQEANQQLQDEDLKTKRSGDLVLATDWNKLFESLIYIGTKLGTVSDDVNVIESDYVQNAALDGKFDRTDGEELQTKCREVETDIEKLERTVEALSAHFNYLFLSSDGHSHAEGGYAPVYLQLKTPFGEDRTYGPGQRRPIVNFSCSGNGKFKGGGKTISIPVDEHGRAAAYVTAIGGGVRETGADDEAFTTFMQSEFEGKSFASQIEGMKTKDDTIAKKVFLKASARYEESIRKNEPFHSYVDHIFMNQGSWTGSVGTSNIGSAVDITVTATVAFPGDPNASALIGTIVVTFNNWIGSWIDDYLDIRDDPLAYPPPYDLEVILKYPINEGCPIALELIEKITEKTGFLQRLRVYNMLDRDIGRIGPKLPAANKVLAGALQEGLRNQAEFERGSTVSTTSSQSLAILRTLVTPSKAGASIADFGSRLEAMDDELSALKNLTGNIKNHAATIVQDLIQENLPSLLDTMRLKFEGFVEDLNGKYAIITNGFDEYVKTLDSKKGEFDNTFAGYSSELEKAKKGYLKELDSAFAKAKGDFDLVIGSAGTLKTDLSNLVTKAGTAKTDLTGVVTQAGTLKTDLGSLVTQAGTAKTGLSSVVSQAGTLKTDLGSLVTQAGTAKTDLSSVIGSASALKSTATTVIKNPK